MRMNVPRNSAAASRLVPLSMGAFLYHGPHLPARHRSAEACGLGLRLTIARAQRVFLRHVLAPRRLPVPLVTLAVEDMRGGVHPHERLLALALARLTVAPRERLRLRHVLAPLRVTVPAVAGPVKHLRVRVNPYHAGRGPDLG